MKKLLCFIVGAILWVGAAGQSNKDIADVGNAVDALRQAMVDGNKSQLEAIAAEELSYGHSSGLVENKAEFVGNIVSGKSDFTNIVLSDQSISVAGNTALVRHKFAAETNNGGTPGKITLHVLLVWQKQKGDWKLLARQATRLP